MGGGGQAVGTPGTAPRYFEDVAVGEAVETPGRTVTEADLVRFAAVSGDHEALDFTRGEPGVPPRVPELLVMALTAGLSFRAPVPYPPILAFLALEWQVHAPVRVGDTLRCRMTVTARRALREGGVLVERREIFNQHGQVVHEGEYKLLVARRPRD